MAQVPKTGDISGFWYLAGLLAACGLALLRALGGKREEEAE